MSRKLSRRDALKIAGMSAMGTVLAACGSAPATLEEAAATAQAVAPTVAAAADGATAEAPTPTLDPASEAAKAALPEVKVPTGKELQGFVPKKDDEKVKLVYWWGNNYEPALKFANDIIARFANAYPDVTVEPVAGQNCDAFLTAAAAGTPPDLFHTWDCVERMGNWAKRGLIIPLDEYIEASDFPMDDYAPGIMDTCRMEGKTWGMVDGGGVFLLWSRPDELADIGHKAGDQPKDTDEMWTWARDLTKKDKDGNIQRLGMVPPSWLWPRFSWVANFGGVLWDTAGNQPTPDHPGVIEALNDMLTQVKHYGVDTLDRWSSSIGSQGGAQEPFLAGNLAMQVDGDWSGQSIFDFHANWEFGKDYFASAPPPPPKAKQHGDSAVAFWTWPWVIPAGTKNPAWSWELLRYFLSTEYQVPVHSKFKELVVRKSMMDDPRLWYPSVKVAKDIVRGSRKLTTVMPMNTVASEYSNLLGEAFDKVLHQTETPEAAMKRVKKETLDKLNA